MQRRLPPPRANEALPARVLAGGAPGAQPTHAAAPAGGGSRRDEAQASRAPQGDTQPGRGVGVAGPAGHLPERTGAPVRDFARLHVPADGRQAQSIAAHPAAADASPGSERVRGPVYLGNRRRPALTHQHRRRTGNAKKHQTWAGRGSYRLNAMAAPVSLRPNVPRPPTPCHSPARR